MHGTEFATHLNLQGGKNKQQRTTKKETLVEGLHFTTNYTTLVFTKLNPGALKTAYSSWACGQLRAPLATTAQVSFRLMPRHPALIALPLGCRIAAPAPLSYERRTKSVRTAARRKNRALPRSEKSQNSRETKPQALKLCTAIHDGEEKLLLGDHPSI
jgi:hypothetical protein